MRNFILIGHRAVTTPKISLNDLPGTGGRMDLITRSVNATFCISHDIRRDVEVAVILLGPENPPKTIRFIGSTLKYLNPDERSTGALIRNALVKGNVKKINKIENQNETNNYNSKSKVEIKTDIELLPGELKSSPGIYISDNDFAAVLDFYGKKSKIVHLDETGLDISRLELPDNCTFILSDDKDFTAEEVDILKGYDAERISLGPIILHTDHCITVIHNYFDRISH